MSKVQKAFDDLTNAYYWLAKSVSKHGSWDDELEEIDNKFDALEKEIKKLEGKS